MAKFRTVNKEEATEETGSENIIPHHVVYALKTCF